VWWQYWHFSKLIYSSNEDLQVSTVKVGKIKGIETEKDINDRKNFLRKIGYKL